MGGWAKTCKSDGVLSEDDERDETQAGSSPYKTDRASAAVYQSTDTLTLV